MHPVFWVLYDNYRLHDHYTRQSQFPTHLVLHFGLALEPIQALQMEQSKGLELAQALLHTEQNYFGLAAARSAAS